MDSKDRILADIHYAWVNEKDRFKSLIFEAFRMWGSSFSRKLLF